MLYRSATNTELNMPLIKYLDYFRALTDAKRGYFFF